MNETIFPKISEASKFSSNWYIIDAENQYLGRLATEVANRLRGKHKQMYTPHADIGDRIIIINASKINVTGKKLIQKNWITTSSAIIEKSLFDGARFNQKTNYIGIEDYLVWLDLHQKPIINSGVLMSPLVLYRLRADSISASKSRMARKIFYLLSNYSIDGKPLGVKKYYYFFTRS